MNDAIALTSAEARQSQARLDAIADAETLTAVSWADAHGDDDLKVAQREGEMARIESHPNGRIQCCYAHAAAAARAAFRAVPALRCGR